MWLRVLNRGIDAAKPVIGTQVGVISAESKKSGADRQISHYNLL
jgi:hypothetical protein